MRTELFYDRRLVAGLICVIGGMSYVLLLASALMSEDWIFPSGGLMGGDHIAFWTASKALLSGAWNGLYDPEAFEAAILGNVTAMERLGLTWQYPPHAALLLWPFGALSYPVSWLVWTAGSFALFGLALRRFWGASWGTIGLVLLSPALFQVMVTGQTGAFTAAALTGALLLPSRKPVLAGLCAGLLTVKPQFGLLLPFAYLAGGHYRSFAVAAATAVGGVAASVILLGPEAWDAFWSAITGVADGVGEGAYPLEKMVTPFAAMRSGGVPETVGFAVQGLIFLFAAALTIRLWRSAAGPEARAAVTACLVFFTTPYAYYYDLAILALPFLFVLSRLEGAAPGRRALLYLCWMTPTWITAVGLFGAQLGFAAVIILTMLALRAAAPQTRFGLAPA